MKYKGSRQDRIQWLLAMTEMLCQGGRRPSLSPQASQRVMGVSLCSHFHLRYIDDIAVITVMRPSEGGSRSKTGTHGRWTLGLGYNMNEP